MELLIFNTTITLFTLISCYFIKDSYNTKSMLEENPSFVVFVSLMPIINIMLLIFIIQDIKLNKEDIVYENLEKCKNLIYFLPLVCLLSLFFI